MDLVHRAQAQGFRIKRTKKGVKVLGKKPEDGAVTLHLTCSDWRAMRNAKANLRRLGVEFD